MTSVLKMLPSAYGLGQYFQDLGNSFSPYGPPSRQITYIADDQDVYMRLQTFKVSLIKLMNHEVVCGGDREVFVTIIEGSLQFDLILLQL